MSLLSSILKIFSKPDTTIVRLNPEAFKNHTSGKKVQLIDVRTTMEFKSGHIKGSKNIDFYNRSQFLTQIQKLNKEKPVYLYCRSGMRSYRAAKTLKKLGFKEIYDLKGGILNWK